MLCFCLRGSHNNTHNTNAATNTTTTSTKNKQQNKQQTKKDMNGYNELLKLTHSRHSKLFF